MYYESLEFRKVEILVKVGFARPEDVGTEVHEFFRMGLDLNLYDSAAGLAENLRLQCARARVKLFRFFFVLVLLLVL